MAEIRTVALDEIKPHPMNPRRGDVDVIEESINRHGFYGVIVAQKSTGYILAGNHRYLAAKRAGLVEVPVHFVDVSDDEAIGILLDDNKTSDRATYDQAVLAQLLGDAEGRPTGINTVYTDDEISKILRIGEDEKGDGLNLLDTNFPLPKFKAKPGTVYRLGRHVLCVCSVVGVSPAWLKYVSDGRLFIPYAGPFVVFSNRLEETPAVMVQPSPMVASYIVDTFVKVKGTDVDVVE